MSVRDLYYVFFDIKLDKVKLEFLTRKTALVELNKTEEVVVEPEIDCKTLINQSSNSLEKLIYELNESNERLLTPFGYVVNEKDKDKERIIKKKNDESFNFEFCRSISKNYKKDNYLKSKKRKDAEDVLIQNFGNKLKSSKPIFDDFNSLVDTFKESYKYDEDEDKDIFSPQVYKEKPFF